MKQAKHSVTIIGENKGLFTITDTTYLTIPLTLTSQWIQSELTQRQLKHYLPISIDSNSLSHLHLFI